MSLFTRPAFAGMVSLSTLTLCACVDLAPAYHRPEAPVTAAWPATAGSTPSTDVEAADLGWREFLLDDRLRSVVGLALANNRDLRVALLNVESARAQYRVQDAARLPSLEGSGSFTRSGSGGQAGNSTSLGVAISGYELDLFGRLKDASGAALESYLATAEGARASRISLVAVVATQWLTLAADMQAQRLNERTLEANSKSLDLNRHMHELGAISNLPVVQAQAAQDAARGAVAAGRTQLLQDRSTLTLLVGQEVPDELLPLDAQPTQASALVGVPAGLPARVLEQRPDVLAAEHGLQAAQLDIGAARAAFFPTITLTGSAGTASTALSGLFAKGSGSWSFGPSISWPILDSGGLQAQVDVARAQRDIALANYEKALQTAFSEVADALAVRSTLAERIDAQKAQSRASEASLRYAEAEFRNGGTSYLAVLDAQRGLYGSQQAEIALDLAEQDNRIALYKALGGGWRESN